MADIYPSQPEPAPDEASLAPAQPPEPPVSAAPPLSTANAWGSALQGILSAIAIAGMLGFALLLVVMALAGLAMRTSSLSDITAIMLTVSGLVGCSLLLLPSTYYGLMRIFHRPARPSLPIIRRLQPRFWILAFPPLLALGYLVGRFPAAALLLLPLLHVVVVAIPVAWMAYVGLRGLPLGSDQRAWGVFGAGLVLGPLLISILEGLVLIGIFILVVVYLMARPDLTGELQSLSRQLQHMPQNPEAIMQVLSPYLSNPKVIFGVMAFAAVIVPVIEEAVKPIGVWLLAGRKLTPQAGLALGVLSGAGYALMESLLLAANSNQWSGLMVARIGTSAIHIFNTGIVGYAIVQAVRRRRYLQLGLTYLAAILLHGLWNALTLWIAFSSLAQPQTDPTLALPTGANLILPLLLIGLALLAFTGLFLTNRRLVHARP